ncbi:CDP-diacylglycerol O-phosphatidyltransferase [bacterium]|nr:CDP-diacylglycerol O-phosphatidyltransferase [bacterium]
MAEPALHEPGARLRAWGVHLYTGSGAVLALLALDAVMRDAFGAAFLWMAIAMFVDCTDGTLARRARVKHVLPQFDGSKLDDIIDYLNYVFVPIVLVLRAGLLPDHACALIAAALPLLASGYGFCQAAAKTPDHFFTGFPSYWNVVALYLFVLGWPAWVNALVLIVFAVLVFVPIRYLYPSRMRTAQKTTYALGAVWGACVFWMLAQFPAPSRLLSVGTLLFPAYYVGISVFLHLRTPPSPTRPADYEDEP